MIDRYDLVQNKEHLRENIELINWIWNSHWWIESSPGYCECKWCGKTHTSVMRVDKEFPLCMKNPAIEKLMAKMT